MHLVLMDSQQLPEKTVLGLIEMMRYTIRCCWGVARAYSSRIIWHSSPEGDWGENCDSPNDDNGVVNASAPEDCQNMLWDLWNPNSSGLHGTIDCMPNSSGLHGTIDCMPNSSGLHGTIDCMHTTAMT
ncbi:hypothetical protein BC833DRAFT_654311 [Globomyces pollinis-pini]|nr:hypothetical protein BC833DRAFT_654311 [Globomyces pollinis-pini]